MVWWWSCSQCGPCGYFPFLYFVGWLHSVVQWESLSTWKLSSWGVIHTVPLRVCFCHSTVSYLTIHEGHMIDNRCENWFSSNELILYCSFQMLSMRNGLSLHPMCLPGSVQPIQLPQLRIGFDEENGALHMNMAPTFPVNNETSTENAFGLPNDRAVPSEPSMSNMMNSGISFGLESSIQTHRVPFQLKQSTSGVS